MKVKKFLCYALSAVMLTGMTMSVSASETTTDSLDSEEFIAEYYEAINEHDWEKVSEFYDSETAPEMMNFLTDSTNQSRHKGLLNVEHVEVVEIIDVDFCDAEYLLLEDYAGKIVDTLVVGSDYVTYEDSEFYANGVCYEVYSLVYESDGWKISEKRTVWDFEGLLDAGYKFNNQYHKTEEVIEARKEGVILNYDGEYIDYVFDEVICTDNVSDIPVAERASTVTTHSIPTDDTLLVYYDAAKKKYHDPEGFHTMCKAITYAEVGSDKTFGGYPEARKACIVAIKTFVWHFYIIQGSKDAAYHVSSSQIAYNSEYKSTYGFLTDYSAVQDVWMQGTSSTGDPIVFEANFKAGSNSSQTSYKGGGDLKQLGCIYLLNNDSSISTYKDLLHYYYDNSPRSKGGAVQFFDANKKFI